MKLKTKYISKSEKAKEPTSKKIEISDEAFAICEFIEKLENRIKRKW